MCDVFIHVQAAREDGNGMHQHVLKYIQIIPWEVWRELVVCFVVLTFWWVVRYRRHRQAGYIGFHSFHWVLLFGTLKRWVSFFGTTFSTNTSIKFVFFFFKGVFHSFVPTFRVSFTLSYSFLLANWVHFCMTPFFHILWYSSFECLSYSPFQFCFVLAHLLNILLYPRLECVYSLNRYPPLTYVFSLLISYPHFDLPSWCPRFGQNVGTFKAPRRQADNSVSWCIPIFERSSWIPSKCFLPRPTNKNVNFPVGT